MTKVDVVLYYVNISAIYHGGVHMKKRSIKWTGAFLAMTLLVADAIPVLASQTDLQQGNVLYVEDVHVDLFQYGNYPKQSTTSYKGTTTNLADAKEALVHGLQNVEEEIDISEYGIRSTEITALYQDAINENPELFYISDSFTYSYLTVANTVEVVYPTYSGTKEEISSQKLEFTDAVSEAMKEICLEDTNGDLLSDTEIVLQIHDYLAKHANYHEDAMVNLEQYPKAHTAYGILVEKTGVCDGYSLAFSYLAEVCYGIDAMVVGSDSMQHAWNIVELDNDYYHIDVTWDDPVFTNEEIYPYYVSHESFLCSDDAMSAMGYEGWISNGIACQSTLYDTAFGKDIGGDFANSSVNGYLNDEWYFLYLGNGIYKYSEENGYTGELVKSDSSIISMAVGNNGIYYTYYGDDHLYRYNPITDEVVGETYSDISNSVNIGFEGDVLYIGQIDGTKIATSFTRTVFDTPEMPETPETPNIPVEEIRLSKSLLILTRNGKHQLSVTAILPDHATEDKTVQWKSADTSVAMVSNDGTVTYIGEGRTIITAQCGSATASCVVSCQNVSSTAGWRNYGTGDWCFIDANGAVVTGWYMTGGKWYYSAEDGVMQTGWILVDNKWYLLNSSGAMQTGWVYSSGKWYYLNTGGAMQTGWLYNGGKWYYLNASGAMQTGWVLVGGKWYYLNTSGAMQTGWLYNGGKWYYLNTSGEMLTGWQWINGTWYYLYENGAMAANTWIGPYYVDASGAWR